MWSVHGGLDDGDKALSAVLGLSEKVWARKNQLERTFDPDPFTLSGGVLSGQQQDTLSPGRSAKQRQCLHPLTFVLPRTSRSHLARLLQ